MGSKDTSIRKAPSRGKAVGAAKKHYDYGELAEVIRAKIIADYGSIKAFFEHEDFIDKCGFAEKDRNSSSMYTYLSTPRAGSDRKPARSFPVMQKLYRGLFKIELSSEMRIVREQVITATQEIKLDKKIEDLHLMTEE